MTQPLPSIIDDPAIKAGLAVKAAFAAKAAEYHVRWQDSDKLIAQQVTRVWDEALAELKRLGDDFNARRQARWNDLEAKIPTGPAIGDDVTEADRVTLHAAFRTAVTAAREATEAQLLQMYRDARRFGDELTQRAVFVVAHTEGRGAALKTYLGDHPETGAALAEMNDLRNPVGRGFIAQALATSGPLSNFPEPPEVAQWAAFEQQGTPAAV